MKLKNLLCVAPLALAFAAAGCGTGTVSGNINVKGIGALLDTSYVPDPMSPPPAPSGTLRPITFQASIKVNSLLANPNTANASGTIICTDTQTKVKISGNVLYGLIGDVSGKRAIAAAFGSNTSTIGTLESIFGPDYYTGFRAALVLGTVKACTAPAPNTALKTTMLPGKFVTAVVDFPTIDLPSLLSDPNQPMLSQIIVFAAANDAYLGGDNTKPYAAYWMAGYGTKGGLKWNVKPASASG
jgi:hypothetical protein